MKPYTPPIIRDRYVLRTSLLYRLVKEKLAPIPEWASLDAAVLVDGPPISMEDLIDERRLETYRRNIKTIVDLAILDGVQVVLTTQPHRSEGQGSWSQASVRHIDQCNEIMREIHRDYPQKTMLVDLARALNGRDEIYTDVAHVTDSGRKLKAELVGNAILDSLTTRTALSVISDDY